MVLSEWTKAFNNMFGEMDSRLKRWKKGEIRGAAGPIVQSVLWEPCFCVGCGANGGYVTIGTPIIYNCEKCEAAYGALPLPKIPDILEREYRQI